MDPAKTGFIKLMNARLSIIFGLARNKEINGRDMFVLLACLHFTNWKTGKSRTTTKKLSDLLGTAQPNIRGSFRRLKACGLIAEVEDRDGTPYMIPHPKLFECASGKARGLLLKAYYDQVFGEDADSIQDEELEYLEHEPADSVPAGDDEDYNWDDEL